MTMDWTISVGILIQIGTMIVLALAALHTVKTELEVFRQVLKHHTTALEVHSDHLTKVDDKIIVIIGDLQRLIGRSEVLLARGGRQEDDGIH